MKYIKILLITFILCLYTTNTPAVIIPTTVRTIHAVPRNGHTKKSQLTNRQINKKSLDVLIGKQIYNCTIIDAFYWNYNIHIICIKDNKFYKTTANVHLLWKNDSCCTELDATEEVYNIFKEELNLGK